MWSPRNRIFAILAITIAGLVVGATLHLSGTGSVGDALWIGVTVLGLILSAVSTLRSLVGGRLGVDIIALLALAGALSVGEYFAGSVISLMLASGRALETWAAGRARRELNALLQRAPKSAHLYRNGKLENVDLHDVVRGDLVMVAAGEVVPVDGVIDSDFAVLDESALSGEALPVRRSRAEAVRSGVVVTGTPIDVRVSASAQDSTYEGIVRLVTQAASTDIPFVRMADRYALGFLGVTLASAAGAWVLGGAARAVAVLVVATPCPLILAAPVAFVSGLSRAAGRGIVVKSGSVLERLTSCSTLLVDKTGTMTMGRPSLEVVVAAPGVTGDEVLRVAASLDQLSPHVVASAVVAAALKRPCELVLATEVTESAGKGIRGLVEGRPVAVGEASWCGVNEVPAWATGDLRRAEIEGSLTVFVARDAQLLGILILRDSLRPDAARTVRLMRSLGISRVVMITGDRREVAESIGAAVGTDVVIADCSPEKKLEVVREESERAPTLMVGDGINDAPALAISSVGVALGSRGATAASEAADVVLTVDRIERLGEVMKIAQHTKRIAMQSMIVGMALSLMAMVIASLGYLPVVGGALLQEVIDVAVILNALRALGGGRAAGSTTDADVSLTQRFRDEHEMIERDARRLRACADALGGDDLDGAMREAREVYRLMVDQVVPHELAEEAQLYPSLGRLIGGSDPTGAMSLGHVEIARSIRRVGQLLDAVGTPGAGTIALSDLRGVMYGLSAVLTLHTAQEEESYLFLAGAGADRTVAPPHTV